MNKQSLREKITTLKVTFDAGTSDETTVYLGSFLTDKAIDDILSLFSAHTREVVGEPEHKYLPSVTDSELYDDQCCRNDLRLEQLKKSDELVKA